MAMLEMPEYGLYCDALLLEGNNLLFLSTWGRDTAIQSFLAALTLGESQGGADKFWIQAESAFQVWVNTRQIQKKTARMPKGSLFGSLVQLWLYEPVLEQPDLTNRVGYLMYRDEKTHSEQNKGRLWKLVQSICPVPLLPAWRDPFLNEMEAQGWFIPLNGIYLHGLKVQLPKEGEIAEIVQTMLLNRMLIVD